MKITQPPIQRICENFFLKLWHLGSVEVQSYQIKSVCVKLQERCGLYKLTSIEDDDSVLPSKKLHSFGLTTRTIEAEFVAPGSENFSQQSLSLFRVPEINILRCFHGKYQYKISQLNQQT